MELNDTFPITLGADGEEVGRFVFRYPRKNEIAEFRLALKDEQVSFEERERSIELFIIKHLVAIENISFDEGPLTVESFKDGDYPGWLYGHISSTFLVKIGSGDDVEKKLLGIVSLNGSNGSLSQSLA